MGAPVGEMNRDFVLQKMKDQGYLRVIQQNILSVVQSSSIDEFSRALGLSPGEVWEVYRQIKDVVIDSEIIGMISCLHREMGHVEAILYSEAQILRSAIDKQLGEVSRLQDQLYETNGPYWLPRDYFENHISTEEDVKYWKSGFAFQLPSILQEKEFRRSTLVNEIKRRLPSQHRQLLVGESETSKTTILLKL